MVSSSFLRSCGRHPRGLRRARPCPCGRVYPSAQRRAILAGGSHGGAGCSGGRASTAEAKPSGERELFRGGVLSVQLVLHGCRQLRSREHRGAVGREVERPFVVAFDRPPVRWARAFEFGFLRVYRLLHGRWRRVRGCRRPDVGRLLVDNRRCCPGVRRRLLLWCLLPDGIPLRGRGGDYLRIRAGPCGVLAGRPGLHARHGGEHSQRRPPHLRLLHDRLLHVGWLERGWWWPNERLD